MSDQLTIADLQEMIGRSKFHQLFQPEVLDVDYAGNRLVVKFKMNDHLERQPNTNQWHGGALSAIIDTTGCYCLAMLAGEPLPTINLNADYLRPAIDTDLISVATIRKAGRTTSVVDVEVSNEEERLIAIGRACYSIKAPLPISQS